MDIYGKADQAIREMNRRNLKAFNKLRLAKWDELNVVRQVNAVYADSTRVAERKYYELSVEAYIVALYEAGIKPVRAHEMADRKITLGWVFELLTEADPVTLYAFYPETERKKQRLIEAMTAAQNPNREIDKALRYWTVQISQYAITSVDRARIQAFRDAGVRYVIWRTEEDSRVCETCTPMDGKVYPIDDIPEKPHINCRCKILVADNR